MELERWHSNIWCWTLYFVEKLECSSC